MLIALCVAMSNSFVIVVAFVAKETVVAFIAKKTVVAFPVIVSVVVSVISNMVFSIDNSSVFFILIAE